GNVRAHPPTDADGPQSRRRWRQDLLTGMHCSNGSSADGSAPLLLETVSIPGIRARSVSEDHPRLRFGLALKQLLGFSAKNHDVSLHPARHPESPAPSASQSGPGCSPTQPDELRNPPKRAS